MADLKDLAAQANEVAQEEKEKAEAQAPVRGRTVRLDRFIRAEIRQPPELIGEVLPGGGIGLLAGQHKVGKTILMTQIAMSVATGEPFLWWKTQPVNVLYLNYEVAEWAFQKRVHRSAMGFLGHDQSAIGEEAERVKVLREVLGQTLFVNTLPSWRINRPGDLRSIKEDVIANEIGLVIIDPIRAAYTGNRNSDEEVDRLIQNLIEEVIQPTQTAVLMGHHMRKPAPGESGGGSTWEVKGSSSWADGADTIITMRHDRKDDTGLLRYLNVVCRHYESKDNLHVKLRPASMTFGMEGAAGSTDLKLVLSRAFSERSEMTMTEIAEVLNCSRSWAQKQWERGELGPVTCIRQGSGKNPAVYQWGQRDLPEPF
jgi:hypothetical protein